MGSQVANVAHEVGNFCEIAGKGAPRDQVLELQKQCASLRFTVKANDFQCSTNLTCKRVGRDVPERSNFFVELDDVWRNTIDGRELVRLWQQMTARRVNAAGGKILAARIGREIAVNADAVASRTLVKVVIEILDKAAVVVLVEKLPPAVAANSLVRSRVAAMITDEQFSQISSPARSRIPTPVRKGGAGRLLAPARCYGASGTSLSALS